MGNLKQVETFEEALKELEEIVSQLEKGDLALDKALSSFQRGVELSQFCQKTLTDAEETVVKMMTDNGDVPLDGEID